MISEVDIKDWKTLQPQPETETKWPSFFPTEADTVAYKKWLENRQPKEKIVDAVNHPPHYTQGGVECIVAIQAALSPAEFRGYCKGNALKYVWREQHKAGIESLQKAQWYLDRLLGVPRAC